VVPNYQRLPARFEIPGGERHSYFGQELLSTDREHAITIFLVSSTIVWLIGLLFVAVAAWIGRRAVRWSREEGVRTRLAPAAVPTLEAAV